MPVWAEDGTADLAVTIAWGRSGTPRVHDGDTATWKVTVTNLGPATAPAVDVVAGGSDQFGRVTSDCGGDDYCALGDIPPGESRTVTFSARACLIQAGDAPARRLWWVSGAAWTSVDPDESNNRADLDVRITGSPLDTACFAG